MWNLIDVISGYITPNMRASLRKISIMFNYNNCEKGHLSVNLPILTNFELLVISYSLPKISHKCYFR